MKHFLSITLSVVASLLVTSGFAQTSAPAFPGAEGFARYTTTGGRGGEVYHVTNLNDSGTGSLRDAVSKSNRIVVFDVSGYIDLKSDLGIGKSNITIAGQTAPGEGITLRYYTVQVSASNVIIRYIRFRRSQIKNVNDGADACWGRQKSNIILDHCSFSWSIDELASFYDNQNFTMQWCSLNEALANPGHSKGEHSYGGIWGGKDASFHHNFLSNMQNRVPRFCGARYNYTGNLDKTKYANTIQAERVDFRNCVMYNWGSGNGCYGGTGGGQINIVNNYYQAGPGTVNKTRVTQVSVATSSNASGSIYMGYACRYYINGNYVTAAGEDAAKYDWSGVKYDSGLSDIDGEKYIPDTTHLYGSNEVYKQNAEGKDCIRLKLDNPISCGDVTTHSPEKAYEKVLLYVGASLNRDACDVRYMEEARTGTTTYTGSISQRAGIIDVVNNPAGTEDPTTASYPTLVSETRPNGYDTDQDGMPDAWEKANGLDPNDASDGKTYSLDSKGFYTNLEVYINGIVEDITKAQNADAETAVEEYYPTQNFLSIRSINNDSTVSRIEYYSLDGKRIAEPSEGISVRRFVFADGHTETDKVIR